MTTPPSKNPLKHLRAADLRGIAQLATQATAGVIRIVEGVHHSVQQTLGIVGGDAPGQTGGIAGTVYRTIHGAAALLGGGVDKLLAALQPLLERNGNRAAATPERLAVLAALNGVMGDHLLASGNAFATSMSLRYRGEALTAPSPATMPEATGKVLLLIHGLCMNDLQWRTEHDGQILDHGKTLSAALRYTPVYLRYNSGLHVSRNGRELAAQLEQLLAHWPVPVTELAVVAHSMGGLLIRSASHYGTQAAMRWPQQLKHIVFLGTPHHGAPLERAGNWIDVILGRTPYTAPFAKLGQLRSAGITDLRHGNVLDEDWSEHDRFERHPDARQPVALPDGVACYTIAATTAAKRSVLADRLVGDGLVPLRSALGRHDDARRNLAFAKTSQWIAYRTNHMALLSSAAVARQMMHWLAPASTSPHA